MPETPDVTPPDLVDGVERAAATADSLTVAWVPGRDDRGVTAYAVDRDGVELEQTVGEPEITIDGLPCGTLTTVGVRALDEAGNEGLRAAASLQTAACDGPADLYLAPKGRDAGRCTEAAPCRTFARAYALAAPGQTSSSRPARTARSRLPPTRRVTSLDDVTFRPAPGAKVTVGSLLIDGSHVTVRDMRVAASWTTSATTEDVTFRNLDVRGGIYLASSRNVSDRRRRRRAAASICTRSSRRGPRAPILERPRRRRHLPRRQPHEGGGPRRVPAGRRRRRRDRPQLTLHALRDLRPLLHRVQRQRPADGRRHREQRLGLVDHGGFNSLHELERQLGRAAQRADPAQLLDTGVLPQRGRRSSRTCAGRQRRAVPAVRVRLRASRTTTTSGTARRARTPT